MKLDQELIESHLAKIAIAPEFSSRVKLVALLRHLVQTTLKGEVGNLKGYAIGLDVFDRDTAFNPNSDSIVRVQAGRLRKLLEQYYLAHGCDGPICFTIPKGSYKVEFLKKEKRHSPKSADLNGEIIEASSGFLGKTDNAISICVLPFTTDKENTEQIYFAHGLSDELTIGLARVNSLSLAPRSSTHHFQDPTEWHVIGKQLGVRYLIDGSVQRSSQRLRVNIQLIDTITGRQLWTQTYNKITDDLFAVQDELVSNMVMELRLRIYHAARIAINTIPQTKTNAWELFMQSNWMPGAKVHSLSDEKDNVATATRALELNPEFGKAHSVMADKLAYLANVDPLSDTPELYAKAAFHARKAIELGSNDVDILFNISAHYWHNGRLKEYINKLNRILELEPNHQMARFRIKAIPYANTKVPQNVINEIIAYDAALTGDNLARWVTLTWISMLYLNNDDYEQAAEYGWRTHEIYNAPDTRNRLCAALVQLGEVDAAIEIVNDALPYWPTTDMRHYANVAIPRRFGQGTVAVKLKKIYLELADVYEASLKDQKP